MGILIDGSENVGIKRGSLDTRALTAAFSVSGSTELTGSLLMTPGAGNTSVISMENPTFEFISSDATNSLYGAYAFRQFNGTLKREVIKFDAAGDVDVTKNLFVNAGYIQTPQIKDDTAIQIGAPALSISAGSDSEVEQLFVHGTSALPVIGLKANKLINEWGSYYRKMRKKL